MTSLKKRSDSLGLKTDWTALSFQYTVFILKQVLVQSSLSVYDICLDILRQ